MNDKYINNCFVDYPYPSKDYGDWLFERTLRIIEENEIEENEIEENKVWK